MPDYMTTTSPVTITAEQRTGPDGEVGSVRWFVLHIPEAHAVDLPEPGTKIEWPDENWFVRGIRAGCRMEWQHPSGAVIGRATIVDRDDPDRPGLAYVMDDTEADAQSLLAELADKYGGTWTLGTVEGPEGSTLWVAGLTPTSTDWVGITLAHGTTPIHAATRLMIRLTAHLGNPEER